MKRYLLPCTREGKKKWWGTFQPPAGKCSDWHHCVLTILELLFSHQAFSMESLAPFSSKLLPHGTVRNIVSQRTIPCSQNPGKGRFSHLCVQKKHHPWQACCHFLILFIHLFIFLIRALIYPFLGRKIPGAYCWGCRDSNAGPPCTSKCWLYNKRVGFWGPGAPSQHAKK